MAAVAGDARRVLVYGGRGALGSRCVQAFRARNWVIRLGLRGALRHLRVGWRAGTLVTGERRGLPVRPWRAVWLKPGAPVQARRECLHVRAQVYCSVPGYECVPTPHPRCGAFALQGGGGWGCPLRQAQKVWNGFGENSRGE